MHSPSQMHLGCLLLFYRLLTPSVARSWTSITTRHSRSPVDTLLSDLLSVTSNILNFTSTPSVAPSLEPSSSPSDPPSPEPSPLPSSVPSTTPTSVPTDLPSAAPTTKPTPLPTQVPTATPTFSAKPSAFQSPTSSPTSESALEEEWHENAIPNKPPASYFNYNPSSQYGPGQPETVEHNATHTKVVYKHNGWATVDTSFDGNYWLEFHKDGFGPLKGGLGKWDVRKNRCGNVGYQSPINVIDTGATCEENHQIRTRKGDWAIDDPEIKKQILPNKLRLVYDRRPCIGCAEPDPPHADLSHNWGGGSDALHIDIKIPSEHLINGKRYDAEYQIFHLHPGRRRTPTISIMIEADSTGHNSHLQKALDQWQILYDQDLLQCAAKQRSDRYLSSLRESDYAMWAQYSDHSGESKERDEQVLTEHKVPETQASSTSSLQANRKLPKQNGNSTGTPGSWNPYHKSFVKTIYFYGYQGSTTDPPCGEWVSWRVLDVPMTISQEQLNQMKSLIFTHVDENCFPTSVHHNGGVVRPIQDLAGRPVWKCERRDYKSDEEVKAIKEAKEAEAAANASV